MSTGDISNEEIQRRAQIRAAKANKQKIEASKAMLDQNAGRNAELAKTARLRALRLKKEAADAKLKKETEMAKPQKTPRKKNVAPVS
jgi:hypothetical protein